MSSMVDPHIGLVSYQQALLQGLIRPRQCTVHKMLTVLMDDVPDGKRITYAMAEGTTVKATVVFAPNGFFEGRPCFQVGYAVAESFRRQGLAARVVKMSVEELTEGFRKVIPAFYIEAVVSPSNPASLRIAESVIGGTREQIVDKHSRESAIRFTVAVGPRSSHVASDA